MTDDDAPILVQLARIRFRLGALDEWRREITKTVAVMESRVNDLRFSDAVADALSEKLSERHHLRLTLAQKLGGGAFAILLVVIPVVIEKFA